VDRFAIKLNLSPFGGAVDSFRQLHQEPFSAFPIPLPRHWQVGASLPCRHEFPQTFQQRFPSPNFKSTSHCFSLVRLDPQLLQLYPANDLPITDDGDNYFCEGSFGESAIEGLDCFRCLQATDVNALNPNPVGNPFGALPPSEQQPTPTRSEEDAQNYADEEPTPHETFTVLLDSQKLHLRCKEILQQKNPTLAASHPENIAELQARFSSQRLLQVKKFICQEVAVAVNVTQQSFSVRLETRVWSENWLEDLDMTVAPQDIANLSVATVEGRIEVRRWLKETSALKDRRSCSPCPPLCCIGNPNGFGRISNLRERDSDWCPSWWVHGAEVSVIVTVAQMPVSEVGVFTKVGQALI
jgi:hypothetical protein